jgi:hypothetical protein
VKLPPVLEAWFGNARGQIRGMEALELCRALENRLLPHGLLPGHDNARAAIGPRAQAVKDEQRARTQSWAPEVAMTVVRAACMIPPLPSSTGLHPRVMPARHWAGAGASVQCASLW